MESSNRPQPSLLLRLALALADTRYPDSWKRRIRQASTGNGREDERPGREAGEQGAIPKEAWERLESVRLRFESELSFADSYLAEDPPRSRIALLLANSSEMRKAAILQRFVERAYSCRLHDPREGLRISDDLIAWTAGDPSPLIGLIRCRAWIERGNLLRILGEPAAAYAALAAARRQLAAGGTPDPLELAHYQEVLGVLERDCGNIEAAVDLLRKALAKVRRWGDPHTLQRVLNVAALAELYNNNFEQTERLLDEAMRIEEPDTLLLRIAAINRLFAYFFSGDPHRAYQALLRVRGNLGESWLRGFPVPGQMRVLWTEGQILNALHVEGDTVGLLKTARELAIRADLGSEACHISIELAVHHAARGRFSELRREIAFGLPFCSERRSLDNYTREAVLLLLRMLEHQGRLEENQVRAVALHLDRVHRFPYQPLPKPYFADLQL